MNENKSENIKDFFLKSYEQSGWEFIAKLRGNFAGFFYNSVDNKLILFTDHLASKPVYYFTINNTLIFSSELKVVVNGMKELGIEPRLSVLASYYLLTFGFMLEDITLVEEVKKVPPGHVLIYEKGKVELKQYHKISSTPYVEGSEDEIIKELDCRFKEAVRLEYEKDLEYNYSHIATMSGGLDSRTNVAYAKGLNFDDIMCFTFSENDYLDEKIAKKICSDYHFGFLFYSLNNGTYLKQNVEEIIDSNGGLIFYLGSAHLYNCLKSLSFQEYGLVHTGQIGDLVLGSYLKDKKHFAIDKDVFYKTSYSGILLEKLIPLIDVDSFKYENDELFAFYERCVNGVFNGYRMIEQFTEYASPFQYLDFLEYAMKVHPKYRYKQAIYLKWISKFKPEFAKYKWEKYGLSPRYPLFLMNLFNKIRHVQGLLNHKQTSMNPTDNWWKANKSLQDYINRSFQEDIDIMNDNPNLHDDLSALFNKGNLIEKTQVLTLLKAVRSLQISVKSK